jgi:hypothetical protein
LIKRLAARRVVNYEILLRRFEGGRDANRDEFGLAGGGALRVCFEETIPNLHVLTAKKGGDPSGTVKRTAQQLVDRDTAEPNFTIESILM